MFFESLQENTDLQFPANSLDFSDYSIGEDFAISPDTLCSLAGKNTTESLNPLFTRFGKDQLLLDEHELALS
ncbi:MAG: hypothetical protein ACU83O_12080 [Gammaproteobacteria bacterium]